MFELYELHGTMEYWNIGMLGTKGGKGYFFLQTHYSSIPSFQDSS
jgi:hypothetical protein